MFGIPEAELLEESDEPRPCAGEPVAELGYNQSEGGVFRDGVDRVRVAALSEDRYVLSYTGYRSGSVVVTRAGVAAMAEAMLTDRPAVPRWLLSPEAARDPPEWVPAGYDRPGSVTCGDCGAEASVRRVVTRDGRDEPAGFRCPDCWERPPL